MRLQLAANPMAADSVTTQGIANALPLGWANVLTQDHLGLCPGFPANDGCQLG